MLLVSLARSLLGVFQRVALWLTLSGIGVGACACASPYPLQDGAGVDWAGGSGGRLEKSPTKKKNSSTLCQSRFFFGCPPRPCVCKRSTVSDHHDGAHVDAKRRCVHQHGEGSRLVHDRMEAG